MGRVERGGGEAGGQLSVAYQYSAMVKPVFTRGDLVKNLPTCFSRATLEAHFSSEYVKVVGCNPDLLRKLWQIIKNKEMGIIVNIRSIECLFSSKKFIA
jgi:hypothetical protein